MMPIIIPIRVAMLQGGRRECFENKLRSIDTQLLESIIIEKTHIPLHVGTAEAALKPLAVGRRVQVLEVKHPSQLHNLDPMKLRAGIISMKQDDLVRYYDKGMHPVLEKFQRAKGKFYLKDLSKEGMIEAPQYKPDLIGLRK
jgi:hypothetical protein